MTPKRASIACIILVLMHMNSVSTVRAADLVWDTRLESVDVSGEGVLPLGAGWSEVETALTVSISRNAPPSVGRTTATPSLDSSLFHVTSFFDVYFDLELRDIDPARDFAGLEDGGSLTFIQSGPLRIESAYDMEASEAPLMGLFPPPASSPYRMTGLLSIPLGGDFNGNGELDVLKLTEFTLGFSDEGRTFITLPDGTVISSADVALSLVGAVVDQSADPPFGPIGLTGPVTASSKLLSVVPEPSSLILTGFAASIFVARRFRPRARAA